ncbi:hypothetical protein J3F84DRAFT_355693 [Trichoderma pleuroticola]
MYRYTPPPLVHHVVWGGVQYRCVEVSMFVCFFLLFFMVRVRAQGLLVSLFFRLLFSRLIIHFSILLVFSLGIWLIQ